MAAFSFLSIVKAIGMALHARHSEWPIRNSVVSEIDARLLHCLHADTAFAGWDRA
jgi:hypothetical protein